MLKFIREIDEGGFGKVSLYQDEKTGVYYAVKHLKNNLSAEGHKSFKREVDIVINLAPHDNIISIYNHNINTTNPYYVMEYCNNGSLRSKLNRRGKFPIKEAVEIIYVLAKTLKYAHSRGIFHRDLKPENILQSGSIYKIADWGIGKFNIYKSTLYTVPGVGTKKYCAPEQWNFGTVNNSTDVYSLGKIFQELLSGQFNGSIDNFSAFNLVNRMTAPLSSARIKTMDEVMNELENLYSQVNNPIKFNPSPRPKYVKQRPVFDDEDRKIIGGGLVAILGIALLGALFSE